MQSTTYFPVQTVYVQTARATRAKYVGFKNLRLLESMQMRVLIKFGMACTINC
jgi:hypothetical protein